MHEKSSRSHADRLPNYSLVNSRNELTPRLFFNTLESFLMQGFCKHASATPGAVVFLTNTRARTCPRGYVQRPPLPKPCIFLISVAWPRCPLGCLSAIWRSNHPLVLPTYTGSTQAMCGR
jgi:hypothetical protein